MPEKIYFPHLQFGGESADLDLIVPSLGEMELDEACINQMMDHDLPKANNARPYYIQDGVFCEPLPMSPAAMGMQDGIAYYPKYRSLSTGGDLQAEHHLACSFDDPQTSFLQELMQTESMTDINGTIPIYNQSINSSGLLNTPTANNTPSTSKAYNIPQLQDPTGNLSSFLFSELFNTECPSVLDGLSSQPPLPTGNSAIIDDWSIDWGQLHLTALTNIDNTNTQAIPASRSPSAPNYNSGVRTQIGRMHSLPTMKYNNADETEINEVVLGCNHPMAQQQAASLPRAGSTEMVKKLPHRRTSSDTNLVTFLGVGTHNPQLLSNETFVVSTASEQTQHKQQRTKRINKPRKTKCLHPYSVHTNQVSVNTSINSSHVVMSSGIQNTASFPPLSYPSMNSTACSTNSPKVIQSRSVPSSPSIHRVTEPLPSAAGFRQQLSSGHRGVAPTGDSKFNFENIALTATPTHVSPTCDLNSGISQEARDEKEKTEAFSRLHQGLHLWEFLMQILLTNEYQPILKWTDKENGIFKIVDSEALARFWGEYRRKPKMNYDKMSRAIRYYYGKDILDKAPKRLYYQFKYHSHWWEKLQKVDPSFKINHIPVSNIPAPSVQDLILPDDL